ncbi:legume-like lectin family domain-containing protein [Phthorimaea operculella]|nr:legume-like lectin family domain-containing protein [Phthorimaea operculella]
MFRENSKWSFLFSIFVFFTPIFAEWNTRDYVRREHSLTKPYQGSGMSVPYWDFLGSTIVTTNYVRLTPDLQSKSGALWNTVPCYTRNWEVQIQFKVHGKGKELFGDGMALWYVRDRMQSGPVFGSKDYFHGLAVILDTYSNHNGAHNVSMGRDEWGPDCNIEGRYMKCRNNDNAASKGRHRHIERPPHRKVATSNGRHIERSPHRKCITSKVHEIDDGTPCRMFQYPMLLY